MRLGKYKHIILRGGLAVFIVIMIIVVITWSKIGRIPNTDELTEIQHHNASEVYTQDSVLLGRYFVENRTNIRYEEIPKNFLNALIATEDARFFEHEGIDYRSLMRVLVKTIILQDRSAGGGSTLSQQLAKNLFPRKGNSTLDLVAAKIKEAVVASRMEEIYSKDELLTLYLNTVSFGEDVYGLETASLRYFNKKPIDLAVQESAILVGILKATTFYNPRLYPDHAKSRRNIVISQMEKYGFLEPEEEDSISALPLELHYTRFTNERGKAPHYKEYIRSTLDSILAQIKKPDGTSYDLYTDGLRVTVPINSKLQYNAEEAVSNHLVQLQKILKSHWKYSKPWDENPEILEREISRSAVYKSLEGKKLTRKEIYDSLAIKRPLSIYTPDGAGDTVISVLDSIKHHLMLLQSGMLAMDPGTGQIKAWVGGIDYEFFQYDHVTASRQVGSTFKPIVYAAALENGLKPCDFFSNERKAYEDYEDWSPSNSDDQYDGYYSLKGALAKSVNTVSAKVILRTGIDSVIALAHRMGIKDKLPEVPSLALGTANLSLLQMVNAYATLANGGKRVNPVYVLKIENADGEILWEYHNDSEEEQVMEESTARLITDFMQSVVEEGTAVSLRSTFQLENEIAGKTGTTQSYADGWFIGFTPEIVAGVWVGADNPGIHFRTSEYGQGARMALPIWAHFMKKTLADQDFVDWRDSEFPELDNKLARAVDCPLYKEDLTLFDRLFGVKEREKKEEKIPLGERIKNFFKGRDQ